MSEIPTVPGSYRVNTPGASVKLDFDQLNAPNRADRGMAQAIGGAGRELGGFADKLRDAVNYGVASDIDRQMRQTAADFQASRVGRDDEGNWQTEWKEKSDELWGKISDSGQLGPALKRQVTQNFKNWQQANAIEVRTMANKQAINRAVDRVGLAADEAAKDGDEQGIAVAFDGAVSNHLLLPEVGQKLKLQYLARAQEYAAKNYIINNPAGAVEFLEAQDQDGKWANLDRLNEDQRLTLLNAARQQFTKFQSDNFSGLIEDLQNGDVKGPAELQSLVAQKVISPKQRKSYELAYRHGSFNTSPDAIGKTFTEITNYDPQQDPDFTKRAELLGQVAMSGFPQNVQSEMNTLLAKKTDSNHVLNTPIAKDAFQAIDQRFSLGLYGKYEKRTMIMKGPLAGQWTTTVDPKVYEAAMVVKRRVEDATTKFLGEHKDATAEDVNKFVTGFQMNSVAQSGRSTILSGLGLQPPPAEDTKAKKARLDAILDRAKKK